MTETKQNYSKDTDGNILFPSEPGASFTNPESRTQRPCAAIRRAASRGLVIAVENEPAPLPDGLCEAVAKERSRALALLQAERIASRINLVVNLEGAIAKGSTPAAVHLGLAQFAREDGKADSEIAAAGILVVHRGQV